MTPIPAATRGVSLAPVLQRVHLSGASFSFLALVLALLMVLVCVLPARRRSPRLHGGIGVEIPHVRESHSGVVTYGAVDKLSHTSPPLATPTFAPPRQSMPILILTVRSKSPPATHDWRLSGNPESCRGLVLKDSTSKCTPLMHRTNGTLRYGEKYRTIGRSFRLALAPIPEEPQTPRRTRSHTVK